jgi:hypothetical protein
MHSLPFLCFDYRDSSRFRADIVAKSAGSTAILYESDILVSHLVDIRSLDDTVMGTGLHTETASLALLDFYFNVVFLHSIPP